MALSPAELPIPSRDGTSQAARVSASLDPSAIALDERTTRDLLDFARNYATRLVYYDAHNQPAGDWSGFFADLPDDQILGFLENPRPDADPGLRRPHFVLFLTLLQLLVTARDALNGLTRRHLDYYFRKVLRLGPRPAEPDQVFVLFDLVAGADAVIIPAGTSLAAGRDASRRDRIYLTESDLLANHAQVAQVASVFAEKRLIGLAEARKAEAGTQNGFMAMLSLTLGEPLPGDPLPPYGGQEVTYTKLDTLAALVEFAPDPQKGLGLQQSELRQLIDRKHRRDTADADWKRINDFLQTAGRAGRKDPNFVFNPANRRDFNANLAAALNGTPDLSGLPEIANVDDLYVHRDRQDVQNAISQKLFMDVDSFVMMMDLKRASDIDWRIVNSLLQLAGRRKRNDDSYNLVTADPTNFAANMTAAVGPVDFTPTGTTTIDTYVAAIVELGQYMFMPAETFAAMIRAADSHAQVQEPTWQGIYATLDEAHRQKVFAARRDLLRRRRAAVADPAEGLRAILAQTPEKTPGKVAVETPGTATDDLLAAFTNFMPAAELTELSKWAQAPATITPEQWTQVYDILERAWRKRTHLPDPVPQREDWLNLYAYADATTVRPATGDTPRWKTFGAAPATQTSDQPPPDIIGLAIGSPLFALSTGLRQITISLGFYDDHGGPLLAANEAALSVQISTGKGWITLKRLDSDSSAAADVSELGVVIVDGAAADYSKLDGIAPIPAGTTLLGLRLRLTVPASAPAIAPMPPGQGLAGCPWPCVRIMLHQIWDSTRGRFVTRYPRLRTLRLARVHLHAAVGSYVAPASSDAITPLLLENDSGPINGSRPFEPFGAQPAAGAMLWIGHPDLANKRLLSLRFRLEWMGGPSDLNANYAAYTSFKDKNFSAKVSLIDGIAVKPEGGEVSLFTLNAAAGSTQQKQDATVPRQIEIAAVTDSLAPYTGPDAATPAASVRDMPHALRLELSPIGFGHQEYPALAAAAARDLAIALANLAIQATKTPINPAAYNVGQPYTPKLKSLALEFLAGHELSMEAYERGPTTDMVFHIHPFGVEEARGAPEGFSFLPAYSNEGELLIGIAGLQPPQTLSLLFQMAEGSANPDVESQPVNWSVLGTDDWVSLPGEAILQDRTRGLINSGIDTFALPLASPDSRLPSGLYWLRATVATGAAAMCDTVAIHAQAVVATRELVPGAAPDPVPLPVSTIKAPVSPIPGLGAVRQPYTSFGGRQAEQEGGFYTAVSERLRHKQRAVTPWDYERLVLQHFPQVYKAKCLSASLPHAPDATPDSDNLGMVRLIVIPDIRGKSPFDPFEPKASSALLADIADFLTPLLPGSARLLVQNAFYVPVRVRVGVRFTDPNNPAFYKQKLIDDLNRYLAPWAYDEGADIIIGRRIYASSIVNFIDQRLYVDYIAGIRLFSSEDHGQTFKPAPDDNEVGDSIGSDRSDAILVAARQHDIDLITGEIYAPDEFKGVNYMKVELDFAVV